MEKLNKKQLKELRDFQEKYNLNDKTDCFVYLLNVIAKKIEENNKNQK